MVAFVMVVLDELVDRNTQRALAHEDNPIQARLLDGPYEALRIRIGVSSQVHRERAVRRKPFGSPIPFIRCVARRFSWSICRQTWGEDRVYFHDDAGQLARLPLQWTDAVPDDPTVVVGAGRAHFRYDDLCRLADLLVGLQAASADGDADRGC
jgi:hypothetical protein